jgi:hypothetical protein
MRQKKIMDKVFFKCNCEQAKGYCGMQCDNYRTINLALEDNGKKECEK